jgi:hypothetical protein
MNSTNSSNIMEIVSCANHVGFAELALSAMLPASIA